VIAAPPAEEKKLTPKTALRKLRSSGLSLRDLAKAAVELAGDEKAAAKELGLTLAQVRSLTKEA
jgi:hypothetical protein